MNPFIYRIPLAMVALALCAGLWLFGLIAWHYYWLDVHSKAGGRLLSITSQLSSSCENEVRPTKNRKAWSAKKEPALVAAYHNFSTLFLGRHYVSIDKKYVSEPCLKELRRVIRESDETNENLNFII